MKNIKFKDIKTYKEFLSKLFNDLEIFGKNEMENLERIEKEEIELLEKIKNKENIKHQAFLTKENLEHEKFLIKEIEEHKLIQCREIEEMRIREEEMKRRLEEESPGPPKNSHKYQNNTNIHIRFHKRMSENYNFEAIIECSLNEKISQLIEKYNKRCYNQLGFIFHNNKFLFDNHFLFPDSTVEKENLYDNCLIRVI